VEPAAIQLSPDDAALVAALRRGDEGAFGALIDRYHGSLERVARLHVRTRESAEEVVQETWVAVIEGIDRFEGRSSLKTWIFRILTNRAKTRGEREGRTVALPARMLDGAGEPAVEAARFLGADHPQWPGHWAAPPRAWGDVPDRRLESEELRAFVERALEALPASQREVMQLRDIEGLRAEDVCEVLGLSEGNQRVLLHRARSKVRRALERYFGEETPS
jgi:RNA polymerase sigma-70 factor (ECF subfamily)